MRQAGLLAACGKVALQESKTNLPLDHQRTVRFGKALSDLAATAGQGRLSISVTPTNMIFVETSRQDLDSLCAKAKEQNILLSDKMPLRIVLQPRLDRRTHRNFALGLCRTLWGLTRGGFNKQGLRSRV